MTFNHVLNMLRFGAVTETHCEFNLDSLMGTAGKPQSANALYELYLKDDRGRLIDIPVLIKNYRLGSGSGPGALPNSAPPEEGQIGNSAWTLHRRFFVFDSVCGIDIPGGYRAGGSPRYVRWANDVRIRVTMDPSTPEAVYRPYVIMDYRSADGKTIDKTTKYKSSFIMEQYSDYAPIMTKCTIAFVCLSVLVVIVWFGRMRNFSLRNPKEVLGSEYISAYTFKALLFLFDTWSHIMFWLLFWSCASVFIAYKLQENAYLLLPELGERSDYIYAAFYGVLTTTFALRTVTVLMRIYE